MRTREEAVWVGEKKKGGSGKKIIEVARRRWEKPVTFERGG